MTIVVAGAGLGGLAAALALARRGHQIDLVERAPALSEAGAGVQLSPNATRVLRTLGLLESIEATAVRPEAVRIRRFSNGAEIACLALGEAATARYGAPFLLAHRADVQAALQTAVEAEPGVTLRLGVRVAGFVASTTQVDVAVATANGESVVTAQGLVGADGLRSAVAATLAGPHAPPRFSGRIAWRSLIPAGDVPPEARLAASQLWLGPHAHLVHYPVRSGALINVVAIVDRAGRDEAAIEDWSRAGEAAVLMARFEHWAPAARRLIAAAPAWRVWPLFDRPPLARWSQGPVTLLGDAAHPALPFLAQGAAQAIEDAAALAAAADADRPFAEAAAAYERGRRATASRVQRESARQGVIYHLAGPLALARDGAIRLLGPARMRSRYDWLYGAKDTGSG